MLIVYSDKEMLHQPEQEWNFGRLVDYPEQSVREQVIKTALQARGFADIMVEPEERSLDHVLAVHDEHMVEHIRSCQDLPEDEAVYPHVFPYRVYDFHPETDFRRAGYFCFDVGTTIQKHTFAAAKAAADVALHGATALREGDEKVVFSLCRPPGHHADWDAYGGYCYFNNAAIAAHFLSERGRVAIVDLDFHHGNGTQGIFYELPHVVYASLHGDPRVHYPYFTGFAQERGRRLGRGTNLNFPLPAGTDDASYREHLQRLLEEVAERHVDYLVVSMGFDTFEGDPLGDFELTTPFYAEVAQRLRSMELPLLAVLEGGYDVDDLGDNAVSFACGLAADE